jgi:hypothetical protein
VKRICRDLKSDADHDAQKLVVTVLFTDELHDMLGVAPDAANER